MPCDSVVVPQDIIPHHILRFPISGPGGQRELVLFTGVLLVPGFGREDQLRRKTVCVNLSTLHGGLPPFDPSIGARSVTAGLASIHGSDNSRDFTWAVDRSELEVDGGGTLTLVLHLAAQGKTIPDTASAPEIFTFDQPLHRVGYHVAARTLR